MPIIRPEVQKVLRTAGLMEDKAQNPDATIIDQLNQVGLDDENIAKELSNLALNSNNEALKLRALETAMKARGTLKDAAPQIPSFTIIIQNSEQEPRDFSATHGVNPILFPRQSLDFKA